MTVIPTDFSPFRNAKAKEDADKLLDEIPIQKLFSELAQRDLMGYCFARLLQMSLDTITPNQKEEYAKKLILAIPINGLDGSNAFSSLYISIRREALLACYELFTKAHKAIADPFEKLDFHHGDTGMEATQFNMELQTALEKAPDSSRALEVFRQLVLIFSNAGNSESVTDAYSSALKMAITLSLHQYSVTSEHLSSYLLEMLTAAKQASEQSKEKAEKV